MILQKVHELTLVERPANFEQYRWETTCSCGWQGRGPTEAVAVSLGESHGGVLPKKSTSPKIVATTGGAVGASKAPTSTSPVVPSKPLVPTPLIPAKPPEVPKT